jgi:hypothetical protein
MEIWGACVRMKPSVNTSACVSTRGSTLGDLRSHGAVWCHYRKGLIWSLNESVERAH